MPRFPINCCITKSLWVPMVVELCMSMIPIFAKYCMFLFHRHRWTRIWSGAPTLIVPNDPVRWQSMQKTWCLEASTMCKMSNGNKRYCLWNGSQLVPCEKPSCFVVFHFFETDSSKPILSPCQSLILDCIIGDLWYLVELQLYHPNSLLWKINFAWCIDIAKPFDQCCCWRLIQL